MYPFSFQGIIFLIPAMIFAFYAQNKVKTTFNRYLRVNSSKGYTGFQVARSILDKNGLQSVTIEHVSGHLTDHYDPRNRVLRLSSNVHNRTSIASISVAAHEVGHAIQHAQGYSPLIIRNQIAPIASFTSQFVWVLVFAGFFLGRPGLIDIGIIFYLAAIAFHIITLPVEYNASTRALEQLTSYGYVSADEVSHSKSVLNAAALTYIAAAAVAIAQLLRLILLRNSRD